MAKRCPIPGGPKTKWAITLVFLFFLLKGLVWLALLFYGFLFLT